MLCISYSNQSTPFNIRGCYHKSFSSSVMSKVLSHSGFNFMLLRRRPWRPTSTSTGLVARTLSIQHLTSASTSGTTSSLGPPRDKQLSLALAPGRSIMSLQMSWLSAAGYDNYWRSFISLFVPRQTSTVTMWALSTWHRIPFITDEQSIYRSTFTLFTRKSPSDKSASSTFPRACNLPILWRRGYQPSCFWIFNPVFVSRIHPLWPLLALTIGSIGLFSGLLSFLLCIS
jgi:hypothetical protein